MNLVAVNIGNTRISCAFFDNGVLVSQWHHRTSEADIAAQSIHTQAMGAKIALCSVVPLATATIIGYLTHQGHNITTVDSRTHKVIRGIYKTMGADRIANAVAAWKLFGKDSPALAIDLGTATTLTAVSANGQFQGGLITLGLGQTFAALANEAALLPKIEIEGRDHHPCSLAFDTDSAITSGTILAHVGLLEHWIEHAKTVLGANTAVVATGGWSETLKYYTPILEHVDPQLTLKGIYLIAEAELDLMDPN